MTPPNILYSSMLMVAGLVCLIAGILVAQRRPLTPGSVPLMVLLFALCWWDLTYSAFWAGVRHPTPTFWLDLTYLGVLIVPTAFLVFAMEVSGLGSWLKKPFLFALGVEPLLALLLFWTDARHGLFFAGLRQPGQGMILEGGPAFWANLAYSYGLLLAGFALLIRRYLQTAGIYRRQVGLVIAGAGLTWLNSIIFMLGLSPFPNADNTPFSFTLAALAFAYALMRYRLLDVVPIARDALIEGMSDGVLVLDSNDRVVDLNPAALRILGPAARDCIGRPVGRVIAAWAGIVGTLQPGERARAEIPLGSPARGHYDLQISPLFDRKHSPIGRLVVWRDISALKRVQDELQELAIQDPLTDVYNRRHFYGLAERELLRAARFKSPCAVVLLDIDFLKRINDTHGHAAGDRALTAFARIGQEGIRKVDVLARLGGDEFAILLLETNLEQAFETADRIRAIVASSLIDADGVPLQMTASFGVSAFMNEGDTIDTLLRRADQALYHAKNFGRNRGSAWHADMGGESLHGF